MDFISQIVIFYREILFLDQIHRRPTFWFHNDEVSRQICVPKSEEGPVQEQATKLVR